MKYLCPICGCDQLEAPAENYMICPSCGVEFGNQDDEYTHAELRQIWIGGGCRWHSRRVPPPEGWNPEAQLRRAELEMLVEIEADAIAG